MSKRTSTVQRTECAVRSHRAVNRIFSEHSAAQRKVQEDRLSGRTWCGSNTGATKGQLTAHYTAEDLEKIALGEGREGAAQRSCYLINFEKQLHKYERAPTAVKDMQNIRPSYAEELRDLQRTRAIIRHEQTIPQRRIMDRFVQLTDAQADLRLLVPNTASVRRRMREHEGWVLNNEYRQQLANHRPLMSRIIEGDYYYPTQSRTACKESAVDRNRRFVRAASAVNSVANGRRPASQMPSGSALPGPRGIAACARIRSASQHTHQRPASAFH